jgi:hypothetical protein
MRRRTQAAAAAGGGTSPLRLHGTDGTRIDATRGRTLYRAPLRADRTVQSAFRRVGRLPNPRAGVDRLRYALETSRRWKPALGRVVGRFTKTNVFRVDDRTLVATVGTGLFTSHDDGRTWRHRTDLPASASPMGVLPSALCVDGDRIYLGEYPFDDDVTPRILVSTDAGRSWSTAAALPWARHVHAVQRDPYTGDVWVTTGDRDDESRLGRLRDGRVDRVGGGSQRWRAVEVAFTPTAVLWGMDCGYATENHLFRLDRAALDGDSDGDPDPTVVHTLADSVYYSAAFTHDDTRWVLFSTAAESGTDSTNPDAETSVTDRARVVVATARSDYTDWHEVATYRRRRAPTESVPPLSALSSNAYVFLAAAGDAGVLVNPFNTVRDDGHVRALTVDHLRTCVS